MTDFFIQEHFQLSGQNFPSISAFKHVGHKEIELAEIDNSGNTAFHVAASIDFLPIFDIRTFIRGGDSNPKNKEGCTPLHIAAEKGHKAFCQLVLNDTVDKAIQKLHIMLYKINEQGHGDTISLVFVRLTQ